MPNHQYHRVNKYYESANTEDSTNDDDESEISGHVVYNHLARELGRADFGWNPEKASKFLLRAGIDGIRYEIGTLSSNAQDGEYNYVVFDDSAITIKEHTRFQLVPENFTKSKQEIVNPIDPLLSDQEKVLQLETLRNEAKPEFRGLLNLISDKLGLKTNDHFKDNDAAIDKTHRSDKPDWYSLEHLGDYYRGMVTLKKQRQIVDIIKMIDDSGMGVVEFDYQKLITPTNFGYRDMNFILRMSNGLMVEFQAISQNIADAKRKYHKYYDRWRSFSEEQIIAMGKWEEYLADEKLSFDGYSKAWSSDLSREGMTHEELIKSLMKDFTTFGLVTRANSSFSISTVNLQPLIQAPSSSLVKQALAQDNEALSPLRSSDSLSSDNFISTSTDNIMQNSGNANISQAKSLEYKADGDLKSKYSLLEEKNLVTIHNIPADSIEKVNKRGGLVMPSIAIIDAVKTQFSGYGDVSLIGTEGMISGKVYSSDGWTVTYPRVIHMVKHGKGLDSLMEYLNKHLLKGQKVTAWSIIDNIEDSGLESGFAHILRHYTTLWPGYEKYNLAYAEKLFAKHNVEINETLFGGYTRNGYRRYLPHTAENALKLMKAEKQGEQAIWGTSNLRGFIAPTFRNIQEVKKNRDRIVSTAEMENIIKESDEKFYEIVDFALEHRIVKPSSAFSGLSTVASDIYGMAKRGWSSIRKYYNTEEVRGKLAEYISYLQNLPTEYFEYKPSRIVEMNEFVAAVIPKGTKASTKKELKGLGLKVVEYEAGNQESRYEAVKAVSEQMGVRFKLAPEQAEIQEAERQMEAVRKQYEGTDQWMKAPNGKPTNLNERQWLQVRTPNFLNWFGDWINDPKNASKLVDENGEPLIAHHGTNREGFYTFDPNAPKATDGGYYGRGIYFTFATELYRPFARGEAGYYGNRIIDAYLNIRNPFIFQEELLTYKGERIDTMGNDTLCFLYNIAKKFPKLEGMITIPDRRGKYNSKDNSYEAIPVSFDEYIDLVENMRKKLELITVSDMGKKYYSVIYNTGETQTYTDRNGLEHSYPVKETIYHKVEMNENIKSTIANAVFSAIDKVFGIEASYHPVGYMTRHPEITNTIIENNYDGILQSTQGDEAVVFSPTQIKSATSNVGTFSNENPDIRYSFLDEKLDELSRKYDESLAMVRKFNGDPEALAKELAAEKGLDEKQMLDKFGRIFRSADREAGEHLSEMYKAIGISTANKWIDTNKPFDKDDLAFHLDQAKEFAAQMGLSQEDYDILGVDGYTYYINSLNVFSHMNSLASKVHELQQKVINIDLIDSAKEQQELLMAYNVALDELETAMIKYNKMKSNAGRLLRHARENKTSELKNLAQAALSIGKFDATQMAELNRLNEEIAKREAILEEYNRKIDELDGSKAELEEYEAQRQAMQEKLDELQAKLNEANQVIDQLRAEYEKLNQEKLELSRKIKELQAKIGQLQNQLVTLKNRVEDIKVELDALRMDKARIMEEIKGLDKKLESVKAKIEKAKDPQDLIRKLKPNLWDIIKTIYYGNMLSGPTTHIKNMMSTSMNMIVEQLVMDVLQPGNFLESRKRAFGSLKQAASKAGEAYMLASTSKYDIDLQKSENKLIKMYSHVFKALVAEDAFLTEIMRASKTSSLAYTMAKGDRNKYNALVENPTPEMLRQIEIESKRAAFNNQPEGLIVGSLYGAIQAIQGTLDFHAPIVGMGLRGVLPFIRVPANVFQSAINWTPLGYLHAAGWKFFPKLISYQQGGDPLHILHPKNKVGLDAGGWARTVSVTKTDPETGKQYQEKFIDELNPFAAREAAMQFTKATIGTVLMALLFALAKGIVSGGGPRDPEKRSQLQKTGWQEYSIRMGGKWVSYRDWFPLALTLSIVGNYYDYVEYNGRENESLADRTGFAIMGVSRMIMDRSFLQGLSELISAMEYQDGNYPQRWLSRTTATMFTPNILKQIEGWIWGREQFKPETMTEQMIIQLKPYTRMQSIMNTVPRRIDMFGEDQKRTGGLWAALGVPVNEQTKYMVGGVNLVEIVKKSTDKGLYFPIPKSATVTIQGAKYKLKGKDMEMYKRWHGKYFSMLLSDRFEGTMDLLDVQTDEAILDYYSALSRTARELAEREIILSGIQENY